MLNNHRIAFITLLSLKLKYFWKKEEYAMKRFIFNFHVLPDIFVSGLHFIEILKNLLLSKVRIKESERRKKPNKLNLSSPSQQLVVPRGEGRNKWGLPLFFAYFLTNDLKWLFSFHSVFSSLNLEISSPSLF